MFPVRFSRCRLLLIASFLATAISPAAAAAQDDFDPYMRYGGIREKFSISGGLLFGSHSTTARLDSETLGVGPEIDFEDLLGFDADTRNARLDAFIRLGKRHQIRLGYISLSRTATLNINEEIQWGDEVIGINETVASQLSLNMMPVNYRFSFVRSERVDWGASIGFFTMFTKAGLAASGEREESSSINLPLPVLGTDVDWAIAPKLFLTGGLEVFTISIAGVSGNWSEFRGGVEYYVLDNIAVGGGYRSINLEVDSTGEIGEGTGIDTKLFFDYGFKGPQVYVTVSF
jgi:opacity protein-like surface antigen